MVERSVGRTLTKVADTTVVVVAKVRVFMTTTPSTGATWKDVVSGMEATGKQGQEEFSALVAHKLGIMSDATFGTCKTWLACFALHSLPNNAWSRTWGLHRNASLPHASILRRTCKQPDNDGG